MNFLVLPKLTMLKRRRERDTHRGENESSKDEITLFQGYRTGVCKYFPVLCPYDRPAMASSCLNTGTRSQMDNRFY